MFICPHCRERLQKKNHSLTCSNNHCFDIAREGYVNLLPVNARKSKNPGDNADMIASRRAFLDSGYYEPLAVGLVENLKALPAADQGTLLDIGCGEGYYTGYVKREFPSLHITGLDISKAAVKRASKRYKDIDFCVASAYELPLEDQSADIILRVFAPSLEPELIRVLKNNGTLIVVTPGKRHLYQLREMIYSDILHSPSESPVFDSFHLENMSNICYSLALNDSEQINNLLNMTPFGWKISSEQRSRLLKLNSMDIECDFNIGIYSKRS